MTSLTFDVVLVSLHHNFEQILCIVLVFPVFTLNEEVPAGLNHGKKGLSILLMEKVLASS